MSLAESVSRIDHLNDEQRECVENCAEVSEIAEWCAKACLGDAELEQCASLCRDVADLASIRARFSARDSTYSDQLADICAEACQACAEECERHDLEQCQISADVFQKCAKSCESMATA